MRKRLIILIGKPGGYMARENSSRMAWHDCYGVKIRNLNGLNKIPLANLRKRASLSVKSRIL